MTAKEALLEHIEAFTEEEAAELLDRLEWEATEEATLTPKHVVPRLGGETEFAAGEFVDGGAFLKPLGLRS